MRSAISIAVMACLALAGCATARKADVSLPAAYEAPPNAAPAGAAALDRWWLNFNDPELTGLIEQALANNPDAKSAASRLKEAQAARVSALSQFLPQGDATAQTRRTTTEQLSGTAANIPGFSTSGSSQTSSANFNVSWEVDLFGRVFAAAKAVGGDVAAAQFDYEGTRASLAAQVADAYFQARGLAIQLDDQRETARIQRSLYDVATKRAQVGIAATSDADRIAGDLAQAESQIATLEGEIQVQKRLLLILAGRIVEPTANVSVSPTVGILPVVPVGLPSDLLARRPDVREAQARIDSQLGRLQAARLAILPTLLFTPGIGWSKIEQPGFSSTSQNHTIGGSITQPVLSIPRLLADARAQGARTEQAVIAYEKAVQTAFSDSEGALVRLDADRRRVTILTDGEARARRAFEASRIGYDRGLTDLQTTLSVEQSWRQTRTLLTSAQVQALRGTVTAYKALGGGWPAENYITQAQAR